jgi:hypothetical protein
MGIWVDLGFIFYLEQLFLWKLFYSEQLVRRHRGGGVLWHLLAKEEWGVKPNTRRVIRGVTFWPNFFTVSYLLLV